MVIVSRVGPWGRHFSKNSLSINFTSEKICGPFFYKKCVVHPSNSPMIFFSHLLQNELLYKFFIFTQFQASATKPGPGPAYLLPPIIDPESQTKIWGRA